MPHKHIPFRPELFWDTDIKTINPKKHARYIIERILEFGNDREIRWVWETYSRSLVRDVVKKSRGLRSKTRILWKLLLNKI